MPACLLLLRLLAAVPEWSSHTEVKFPRSMLIIPSGGPGDEAWGTFADKVDAINTTLAMLGPMPSPIADDNSNSLF